jgi:hypothetical protein
MQQDLDTKQEMWVHFHTIPNAACLFGYSTDAMAHHIRSILVVFAYLHLTDLPCISLPFCSLPPRILKLAHLRWAKSLIVCHFLPVPYILWIPDVSL